ncbi:putative peptidoglycan glycosyltransferase FtsW [Actinomyces sp. F1_1611]
MAVNLRVPKIKFARANTSDSTYSPIATYYMILVAALMLAGFGVIMTFSATAVHNISMELNPYLVFSRNVVITLVSLMAAVAASRFRPTTIRRWSWALFLAALVFQLMVVPFGYAQGGNQNWVRIPVINQMIQPSELLKLATCLMLAQVLANLGERVNNWKAVAVGVGLPAVASLGAVMLGHDMGTALIFLAITVGALWVAGAPLKWFGAIGLAGLAASAVLVMMNPSRLRRVMEILPGLGSAPDPSAPTQTAQGLWALGSGGLIGLGPGASRAKWNYLQEAESDFILAIVGEEFGLIGTLTLVVTLGVLVWGTLRLASHSPDAFVRIASGGIAAWLIFQGFVNIGSVTGLTPVIGVPFPLVSYGGSAFLFTALAIGVLLAFARSEAGLTGWWRNRAETGPRDPRVAPKRTRVRRTR